MLWGGEGQAPGEGALVAADQLTAIQRHCADLALGDANFNPTPGKARVE